jgi:hypothetical protein
LTDVRELHITDTQTQGQVCACQQQLQSSTVDGGDHRSVEAKLEQLQLGKPPEHRFIQQPFVGLPEERWPTVYGWQQVL